MTPPTRNRPPTLVVIAAAILFILLAVLEVMAGEPTSPASALMDEALARGDIGAAERHWHDAYRVALGSRRWEGMIEVGDGARRIGEVTGARATANTRARQAYLTALLRARQQKSLDGVLRTAEAFSGLGDRQVVAQCLRIAEHLAAEARDAQARERVSALSERLATNH